jgi:3-hydroxybutyrate dehydrogenase
MLAGKLAIVTGSTSGIGLGIARSLAAAGANIVINGFGPADEVEKIRAKMQADFGVKVVHNAADLAKPAQIADLMRVPQSVFGRHADILVNNAGIQHVAPIEHFPQDKWDLIIAVNLTANYHTMSAAIKGMKEQGWGRVINVASVHGKVASVHKSAYVASKHGVIGLTKVAALETARHNITCNAICPGWVLTPLVEAQIRARCKEKGTTFEAESQALLLEKQPSGKFATPEDLGAVATFLCSDSAAQITGDTITMDGGWTAH